MFKTASNKAAASENPRRAGAGYVAGFERRENEVDGRFQHSAMSR